MRAQSPTSSPNAALRAPVDPECSIAALAASSTRQADDRNIDDDSTGQDAMRSTSLEVTCGHVRRHVKVAVDQFGLRLLLKRLRTAS